MPVQHERCSIAAAHGIAFPMTGLPQIIAALQPTDGGWHGVIPDAWLQGRTSYGGLSAALALHAAQRIDADLPALRSAQIAFIGPLAGRIDVRAQLLRRGRNAAWVQADVTSDAGLGLRAIFVFMGSVDSAVDHRVDTAPPFPAPGLGSTVYNGNPAVPFTRNFEFVDDRKHSDPAEWLRWVRLVERSGLDPMVELIAVADCLPPSALKLLGRLAPMSSMTWQLNVLGPAPATTDGWWLLRVTSNYARAGNSSQTMQIWNHAGEPIGEQTQSVALFA